MANNLIIKVDQIEEPRQLERRSLTKAFLEEVFKDAPEYEVAGPSEVQAHLTRVGERDVVLEGSTGIQLKSECRRCLKEVSSDVPVVFTLNLLARKEEAPKGKKKKKEQASEEDEETLSESDLDEETFDGDTIDLGPILREQLLLGLPAIEPLCQEDCKGLCPTCGQDLNEKDCGHGGKQTDPRWAALKNLKA